MGITVIKYSGRRERARGGGSKLYTFDDMSSWPLLIFIHSMMGLLIANMSPSDKKSV